MKKLIAISAIILTMIFSGCHKTDQPQSVEVEILKILHESGHKDLMAYGIQDIREIREKGVQRVSQNRDISGLVSSFTCIRMNNQFYAPTATILTNVIALYGTSVVYSPYDTDGNGDIDSLDLLAFIAGYGVTAEGVDFTCWEEVQYYNEGQTEMGYTCFEGDYFFAFLRRTPSDEPGYDGTGPDAETYDVNSFDFDRIGLDVDEFTYVQ